MAATQSGLWHLAAALAITAASIVGFVAGDGLNDIDHVVLFMQENRAFDHYFGTMAGVRGFSDANIQENDGVSVWKQKVSFSLSNDTDYLMPWYLNYLGGNWTEATQCMVAGSNGWFENHAAWNGGTNDHWALNNTPFSLGFYKRQDLPAQWSLAESWIIGDMYQESVVAATNPNRVMWMSGSVNAPGGNLDPSLGGNPYIDNNEMPGCDGEGINCYPLKWKTAPEYYEEAGTTWAVFQDGTDDYDNFDDNPLAWFKQFQDAKEGSPLHSKGMQGKSLQEFYDRAKHGTLPEVSIIVGYRELSEHPPYSPHDGSFLQHNVAEAVIKSPKYNKTALIVSFDETGGWFDHVNPYHAPKGTPGEWYNDKNGIGYTFTGPGFRVPFYIISPWTRRGGVFVEHADHTSQMQFIEKWQQVKSRNVQSKEMDPWRREKMSDLVGAFDFENPDYSVPVLTPPPEPYRDSDGKFAGSSRCEALYAQPRPPVPYTGPGATLEMAGLVERGFKPVRGRLTEGRHLVLEMNGFALTSGRRVRASKAREAHDAVSQRWKVHVEETGGDEFRISSSDSGEFMCARLRLCNSRRDAVILEISFRPSLGYSLKIKGTAQYLAADADGRLGLSRSKGHWTIFSVSY